MIQNNLIAMWSGPRNISTAIMYAFDNRNDCTAWDEPFYACYLKSTGLDHPMRSKIIADGDTSVESVIARCSAAKPKLFYQKHMTQHMTAGLDRGWINNLNNAFLIRSPNKVLASYTQKRAQVSLVDIGFVQQVEIFRQVSDHLGCIPPVIDSDLFLANPEKILRKLCERLTIPFDDKMLSWPAGPKSCDGVWARHWYNAAHKSTGFASAPTKAVELPNDVQKIADQAQPFYETMLRHAL